MTKIELITNGCDKCIAGRDELKAVADEIVGERLVWRDISVLDELDYAIELGVLTLPALAIDGRLVSASLPAAAELRAALLKHGAM